MKKRFISIMLCMAIIACTLGAGASIAADNAAATILAPDAVLDEIPINVVVDKDALYISGYPDNTFKPENKMTRAEAVKTVAAVLGYTDSFKAEEVKTRFTDISESDWYAPYLLYLESKNMVGFFGSKFQAGKEITRGEFVRLIYSLFKKKNGESSFSDLTESYPFYEEIIKAANAGIIKGYPDGTFRPDETLKRCEIVVMLNRVIKRCPVELRAAGVESFSDVDSHWAKSHIVASSSKAFNGRMILWYTGDEYAANSPLENANIEVTTTTEILASAKSDSAEDVEAAVEAYADKRRKEIRETPTSVKVSGTSYYVSNDGNDNNDGLTPETAWKTTKKVSSASLKAGDGVFFKRGDTFRGQIITKDGVTYSAYGEGPKPNIYGSERNYSESDFWEETETPNVYVSTEHFQKDVGLIVFNEGEAWSIKQADGLLNFKGVLKSDLEMYHNPQNKKVYLYSVSDPDTRFTSTEIGYDIVLVCAAQNGTGKDITIDNLCLKYTGGYGVEFNYGVSNITVQNCEIGWIGGSLQDTDRVVRYGNGVEFYGSVDGGVVDNCYIYQVYDAGITHQYYGNSFDSDKGQMQNIKYTDNLVEYCTWAIEVVNRVPYPSGFMRNVEISGNLFTHAGDGWGQQRPHKNPASFVHGAGTAAVNQGINYYVFDNVIYSTHETSLLVECGARGYADLPRMTDNIFLGVKDNYFGLVGPSTAVSKVFYTQSAINKTVGFEDNKFFFLK